ncbi:MAG: PIN domain-containing protein [Dehalococcoidia bacterium]
MLVAILDACVLFSVALCDTLLRAAEQGLFRVHWSDEILQEVQRALVASGRVTPKQASYRTEAMTRAFPEAAVTGYEPLISRMTNDLGDRHVLAAAVAADAQVIVTRNLRHFFCEALEPWGVVAQSPDRFLTQLFELQPDTMVEVVRDQAASLFRQPMSVARVLDGLEKNAPIFVNRMREKIER